MNKTIANDLESILFKRNTILLTENKFKVSQVPQDVENDVRDILTKAHFSQTHILTTIAISVLAAVIINNSDISPIEQNIFNVVITLFTTVKLYQYKHGTEHTAKTPLENEPILNPEVFREGNPNVELALNIHEKLPPIKEHPQLGIFNASKTYRLKNM